MTSGSLRKIAAFVVVVASLFVTCTSPVMAQGASITLYDSNCTRFDLSGSPGAQTLTCVVSTSPTPGGPTGPTAPTGCIPWILPYSLTNAGGDVNVGVSGCPAGTVPWWTRNGVSWVPTTDRLPPNSLTTAVTTSYQVTVCNGSACTTLAPVTAIVPGTGGTGGTGSTGGTGGTIGGAACPGYSRTMFYNWNWASGSFTVDTYNSSQGPIGPNGIVVIEFTPVATGSSLGVAIAGYPGNLNGTDRAISISTAPCDFSQPFPWTRYGYDTGTQYSIAPSVVRGLATLVAGTRYYLNIASRNEAGVSTCQAAGAACDMRISANVP